MVTVDIYLLKCKGTDGALIHSTTFFRLKIFSLIIVAVQYYVTHSCTV